LKLHPIDFAALFIVLHMIVAPGNAEETKQYGSLFRFLWKFIVFAIVYGALLSLLYTIEWTAALNELKNYLFLLPVLYVLPVYTKQKEFLHTTMWLLLVAGLLIALPGIAQYWAGGYTIGSTYSDAFNRASYAFWGSPMAVLVLTVCLQAHWYLWGNTRDKTQRIIVMLSTVIQLYGIYISGTRNMWIATLLTGGMYLYFRYGIVKSLIILPVVYVAFTFAPEESFKRLDSFYFLHETDQYGSHDTRWLDSSGAKRAERMEGALRQMEAQPWGNGWGSAGWVHSDFLSIGVIVGVIPAVLFFFFILKTEFRVFRIAKRMRGKEQWFWLTMSGMMITFFNLFSFGGVTWLIQYAMPAWFALLLPLAAIEEYDKVKSEVESPSLQTTRTTRRVLTEHL